MYIDNGDQRITSFMHELQFVVISKTYGHGTPSVTYVTLAIILFKQSPLIKANFKYYNIFKPAVFQWLYQHLRI